MKKLLLALMLWCMGSSIAIQAQHRKEFKVLRGQVTTEVIPEKEQYRFSEFKKGTVFLYNGDALPSLLNFNYLYSHLQYINPQGDTLFPASNDQIKGFTVDSANFTHHPKFGYLEQVIDHPSVKLNKLQYLQMIRNDSPRKMGGGPEVGSSGLHGANPAVVQKQQEEQLSEAGGLQDLYNNKATGVLVLVVQQKFYFSDKNNWVLPAKKKSIRKIFPHHKKEVYTFIEENDINFDIEADLTQLVDFCSQLKP